MIDFRKSLNFQRKDTLLKAKNSRKMRFTKIKFFANLSQNHFLNSTILTSKPKFKARKIQKNSQKIHSQRFKPNFYPHFVTNAFKKAEF